jgi:hypothetical protein
MYSRLIHTVDHVEGHLREGFDALDAFLAHAWEVTVTGAPKTWAMQFIEDHEKSPRAWYGGAVGLLGFDGNMNTGLTLRTIRVKDGVAEMRAGATLLYDSDPDEEERETRIKASAFIDAIRRPRGPAVEVAAEAARPGEGRRILLVDHQDSFVHTLANYFRQTGAEVLTLRAGFAPPPWTRSGPIWSCCLRGPGGPATSASPRPWPQSSTAACPPSGSAWDCREWWSTSGASWASCPTPCTGRPRASGSWAAASSTGCPRSSPRAAIIPCSPAWNRCPAVST